MFGFLTGWRFDEIQGLEWRNVDFTAGEVRLFRSKNEDGRVFPFTEEIRSILEARRGQSGRFAKVFPQEAFRKRWATACHKALRTFHDLRHSAAREMSRHGVPERVIVQLMGWKTRSVFDRCRIVSDGDLRDAARKLDGARNGAKARTGER